MTDIITSVTNQKIKRLVSLRQKARSRRSERAFIIEGTRLFLDTPERYIREIYITRECEQHLKGAQTEEARRFAAKRKQLEKEGVFFTYVTEEVLAKASDIRTPQGILCVVRMPQYEREDLLGRESAPLILIAENIQDPGNLGTMFRTAEAAGVTGLLLSADTVDVFNPKTVRSTMSSIFRLPFYISRDLASDLVWMKEQGIQLFAACLDAQHNYDETSYQGGTAFLIGNEGSGLTTASMEAADEKIIIPMEGRIESLNAAVSSGILLYEAYRQRRSAGKR